MVNQLTLLDTFDKQTNDEEVLVDLLIKTILNLVYIRTNTKPSDFKHRDQIVAHFDEILLNLAHLTFKKARYVNKYRGSQLEDFKRYTIEKPHINVSDVLSTETLSEYYSKVESRLNGLLLRFKGYLKDDRQLTKEIFANFAHINLLKHAV